MKGWLITFEGIEGVGKTTQVQKTFELLEAEQPGRVLVTREPGGTPAGEAIRALMLQSASGNIDGITEMLLVFAARRQHLRTVIEPALQAGKIVLCDRFTDATFAYQGGGRGVPEQYIERVQDMVQDSLRPHLTLLFDAPPETGLARLSTRKDLDRMETETVNFFRQVRTRYLELAARHPERIHVIDATAALETVTATIRAILEGHKLC